MFFINSTRGIFLNFFGQKENAFLFMHYFDKKSERDINTQNDVDKDKLTSEMEALNEEAEKYIPYIFSNLS